MVSNLTCLAGHFLCFSTESPMSQEVAQLREKQEPLISHFDFPDFLSEWHYSCKAETCYGKPEMNRQTCQWWFLAQQQKQQLSTCWKCIYAGPHPDLGITNSTGRNQQSVFRKPQRDCEVYSNSGISDSQTFPTSWPHISVEYCESQKITVRLEGEKQSFLKIMRLKWVRLKT